MIVASGRTGHGCLNRAKNAKKYVKLLTPTNPPI